MSYLPKLTFAALFTFSLAPAGAGCLFVDDGADAGPGIDDDDDDGDVEARGWTLTCSAEASVEITAEAEILVEAMRTSFAEMIGCGRATVAMAGAMRSGIADAILDGRPDATPEGWNYAGEGRYTTSAPQAQMENRFYLSRDFEFGSAGDIVEENVFLLESYLSNASLRVADPLSPTVELHFDEPGPLVELLGYGATPPNPIIVDWDAVSSLGNKLAALEFEATVDVADLQGSNTIMYSLHTERMPADDLLIGRPLVYELDTLVARKDQLDTEVTDWDSSFFESGRMEGEVTFDVEIDHDISCEGSIDFPSLPQPSGD